MITVDWIQSRTVRRRARRTSELADGAPGQHVALRQAGRRAALDLVADEDLRPRADPRREAGGIGTAKRASAGATPSEAGTVSPSGSSQSSNDRPGGAVPASRVKRSRPASRSTSATSCTSPTIGVTVATSCGGSTSGPAGRDRRRRGPRRPRRGRHAAPERRAAPEPREQRRRPAEQPLLDARLQPARRRGRGEAGVERREGGLPAGDLGGEGRVGGDPGGAGGLLGRVEQPQHVLGRQRGVRIVGKVVGEARVAHDSRHFLSAISARRNQVRMVLSGTSKARASSS